MKYILILVMLGKYPVAVEFNSLDACVSAGESIKKNYYKHFWNDHVFILGCVPKGIHLPEDRHG